MVENQWPTEGFRKFDTLFSSNQRQKILGIHVILSASERKGVSFVQLYRQKNASGRQYRPWSILPYTTIQKLNYACKNGKGSR